MSRAPDLPFKEMSSQCEALCMGKHQKRSVFMSFSGSWQAAVPGNKIGHTEAIHISNEQAREVEEFTFEVPLIVPMH